jgi:Hemerythrin HHE cation binding domain
MRTTTQEPLSSGDARAAILICHDELRGLVTETIHAAESATRYEHGFEPLRIHARELYEACEAHMDFEERILAAALRDVIGIGSVLQAQVVQGHEKQRVTLEAAMSALDPDQPSPARLVESIREFTDKLLTDLTIEERCLLSADVDEMVIDTRGG